MIALSKDAKEIMVQRFGHDNIMALASCVDGIPYVRNVNAYYQEGSFYILTYGLSGKMQQIKQNPTMAIAGDWFTGHGTAVNMGWFGKSENRATA